MVQFFHSPTPRRSLLQEQIGMNLGKGLSDFMGSYFANKSLENVLGDESLKNAPLSEKMGRLQSALAPYGEKGQQLLQGRMQSLQQQQAEKAQQSQMREQELLGRVIAGEPVSGQELAGLSPQTQLRLVQIKQQQEQQRKKVGLDQLSGTAFSKGYKAILDNDMSTFRDVISDPNVPLNIKKQLGDIQNQHSTREDVKKREIRNRQTLVQSAYAKAITAERNKIGKMGGLRRSEIAEINNRIAELEKLRQKDMKRLLSNSETYNELNIWGNPASEFVPQEKAEVSANEEGIGPEVEEMARFDEKVKFNPSNPEHVARAKQVLAEAKGDRAKANKILAEEFEK